jgi:cbb3-type cytochrome oxidase subunit 1
MDRLVSRCIIAALVYFALGAGIGVVMVFWPEWPAVVRTVHTHINLSGWLAMVVYAAGYGVVPRLAGRPLYSPRLGNIQFRLANASLVAVSLFWIIVSLPEPGTLMYALLYSGVAISAVLLAVSAVLFVFNMVMTLKRR